MLIDKLPIEFTFPSCYTGLSIWVNNPGKGDGMSTSFAMNIASDLIGIIILVLMVCNFGSGSRRKSGLDDRIFTGMLWVNIALLATDMMTWIFDGTTFPGARFLNVSFNFLHFILQPLMGLLWLLYCEYKLTKNTFHLSKRLPIYMIPMALGLVIGVVNLFIPLVFSVSQDNIYAREPCWFIYWVLCFIYLLIAFIISLRASLAAPDPQRRHGDINRYLLLYPLFPILGTIIQAMFYGIAIIWISSILSLLILYFNLQNALVTIDPLTGISNRQRFEDYMRYKLRNRQSGTTLFVLMIDIDHFKEINDRFGHLTGDDALRKTAHLLIHSIPRNDFIARIGGDEFVIIGERAQAEQIEETLASIKRSIRTFNDAQQSPFELSLSLGLGLLAENEVKSIDHLISEADRAMYKEKNSHHTARTL